MKDTNICFNLLSQARDSLVSLKSPVSRRRLTIAILAGFSAGLVIGQLNYSFGVFVPYWSDEFPIWSRTEVNASFSIAQVTSSLVGFLLGILLDKFGARIIVTISLLLVAIGFAIVSLIPKVDHGGPIFQLWGGYLVIGLGYCGASVLGGGKLIGTWFPGPKRGRVMGIVTASNNLFGGIMVQTSTEVALSTNSWRNASWTFSGIVGLLAILYWLGVRDEPPSWFKDYELDASASDDAATESELNLDAEDNPEAIKDSRTVNDLHSDSDDTATVAVNESKISIDTKATPNVIEEEPSVSSPAHDTIQVSLDTNVDMNNEAAGEEPKSESSGSMFDDGLVSSTGNDQQRSWELRYALTTFVFWTTTMGMLCAYWTFAGVLSQLIPALLAEGFENSEAANIVSLVAVAGIVSKITCGRLSERFSARYTLMGILVVQGLALCIFVGAPVDKSPLYTASCIIYGLSFGGVGAMLPLVALETFGVENYGKIYGLISMFFIIPSLGGPIIAGRSLDGTGSYKTSLIVSASVLVLGAFFLFVGRPTGRCASFRCNNIALNSV